MPFITAIFTRTAAFIGRAVSAVSEMFSASPLPPVGPPPPPPSPTFAPPPSPSLAAAIKAPTADGPVSNVTKGEPRINAGELAREREKQKKMEEKGQLNIAPPSEIDLPTQDIDRAAKFYTAILNETVKVNRDPVTKIGRVDFPRHHEGPYGGDIILTSPDRTARLYLNVEGRIHQVLSRVPQAGGKIVEPVTENRMLGKTALFVDTEGNLVGLVSLR